jgi:hypothetical protein
MEGVSVAGSGRARRFRQAREMKQGTHEEICSACHANLTLGEQHDPDCDFAARVDPWADDGEEEPAEDEEDAW